MINIINNLLLNILIIIYSLFNVKFINKEVKNKCRQNIFIFVLSKFVI